MLYTKDGFPEVNEVVLCVVKKIESNTTFVYLPEYEKDGVLTISEIAAGRIRNLRDHVMENKEIICKVLRVDKKYKRIDVSLRRVSIKVMKDKLEKLKKEEYSDRIYEDVSKELNISKESLFEKTYEPIFEKFETVFEALYEIMLENDKINMFSNLDETQKQKFIKIINDRIKPEIVELKKKFILKSLNENGIDLIKQTITNALKSLNYDKIKITYLAAGTFDMTITHDDIKTANKLYMKFKQNLETEAKTQKLILEIKE